MSVFLVVPAGTRKEEVQVSLAIAGWAHCRGCYFSRPFAVPLCR